MAKKNKEIEKTEVEIEDTFEPEEVVVEAEEETQPVEAQETSDAVDVPDSNAEPVFEDPITGEIIKGEAAIKAKADQVAKIIQYGETGELPSQDIAFGDDGVVCYKANGNMRFWRIPERTFAKWNDSDKKSFLENQGVRVDNVIKPRGEIFQKVVEDGKTYFFIEERL